MTQALVIFIGVLATLLASCAGAPPTAPTARIVVFTASADRIPRNTDVTLLWQAADAGVQDGLLSCVLTRRFGDDPTETPLPASCSGGLTEVPPAPLAATTVEYRFKVLKQPYDATNPYLIQTQSVTLDPALYAVRAGGTAHAQVLDVSTLSDGSAIVTGAFGGDATFGTTTLTSAGNIDGFVARIHPDGTWAWATSAGGTGNDGGYAVSALADGGAIVAGYFSGAATIGTTLASVGLEDAFVARVRPNGTWAWAARAGGTNNDTAWSVSSLADGGAIVAGRFSGSADFGTDTLTSAGSSDAFVARIDAEGTWAWATRAGGSSADVAQSVATLPDGSALVTGTFSGTADFGTATLTSAGSTDAFVARIQPDGTWAWAISAGGTDGDEATGGSIFSDGSAIVAGYFAGTATFGTTTLTSTGIRDAFIARVHHDGSWAWATAAGGASLVSAQAVSTNSDGGAIVVGQFHGTAAFGATSLTSGGHEDVFVARIHPDGTWAWATGAGGSDSDLPRGVIALADGGAIVAGFFSGTTTFGTTTLTSAGGFDAFVARIGADGAW